MTDQSLTLTAHITPDQTYQYVSLPFEVPEGIGQIAVAYQYDGEISSDPAAQGGNTIDIGIIDARGSQFMTPGFRGWSGSARHSFEISTESTTPGYMPGPIQPGTWSICLGIYKVAPTGCTCTIDITLSAATDSHPVDFPPLLPVRTSANRAPNADGWYKGELHCHTVHSDGDSTVAEVIGIAESLGLDFLAITDHNNRSQWVELATSDTALTLIPGYEVTTYYGHWNIWGAGDWIDFRVQSPADLQQAIDTATAQGYLVSCNHPRPFGPEWAFNEVIGYACVEIWNGPWPFLNDHCLAFWEARLKADERLVAVGGSDFHFSKEEHPAQIGQPATFIHCPDEPSAANLLKHLRAGHAFVSESANGPQLDLQIGSARMGDAISATIGLECLVTIRDAIDAHAQLYTRDGLLAQFEITKSTETFTVPISASLRGYVRAQIIDPTTGFCRAIGNPIYLENQH